MAKREMVLAHVEKLLERITGNDALKTDPDGDWPFRFQTSTVFVRVLTGDNPNVFVFALAAVEVPESLELFKALNGINQVLRFARCYWLDGAIYVEMDAYGETVDAEELDQLMRSTGSNADLHGPLLVAEFGGRTHHEPDPPAEAPVEAPVEGSGGTYL